MRLTALPLTRSSAWCAPDMGVNWRGKVPAYVNTVVRLAFMGSRMTQVLERGNCGIAMSRGKEVSVKPDEPTNRKII